jgi:hypothetical protein
MATLTRKKSRPSARLRVAAVAAPGAAKAPRLPHIAKGRRPTFYEDPAVDQLFAIVTALTGEISVLFDRLDTVQRLLDAAGVVSGEAIAGYVPDAPAATARGEQRDELLRRVFAVLEVYAAGKAAPPS